MRVWRIAGAAQAAFDGEGARRYGSRWTPRGVPVVFTSATLSLAALERFVHTEPDLEPTTLVAIPVDIGDDVLIESVDARTLPADWRAVPARKELAAIGERWFHALGSAVLSVPSAVIPHERNFALNPTHHKFRRLTIGRSEPFSFDPRMWKK